MVNNKFNFLDSTSESGTSNNCKVDPAASVLTIQVYSSSNVNLKVQGITDTSNGSSWVDIATIALKDLSKNDTITANGIYQLGVDGLAVVRVVSSGTVGSVKVFGTFTC